MVSGEVKRVELFKDRLCVFEFKNFGCVGFYY